MAESIVVTRPVPNLKQELKRLPPDWDLWVHDGEEGMTDDELCQRLQTASGVLVAGSRVTADMLDGASKLRAISNYGAGVDNIDVAAARARGILVANLPEQVTYSTAELAIALMLSCVRRIAETDRYIRRHLVFPSAAQQYMAGNLHGKTLGIVGFGRIGQKTAELARAFGMDIVYYNSKEETAPAERLGARYCSLDELLSAADIVSLHIPGRPENRNFIGSEQLAKMKPGAVLVNTARGMVVDQDALAEALESHLGGAGLDVFADEPHVPAKLADQENAVLTPHIGTAAWETRCEMTRAAVDHLQRMLLGQEGVPLVT